tara:strand:+ start:86 stop:1189 length:1104 start_codon:yes stop_codon:yes gene_type:complete
LQQRSKKRWVIKLGTGVLTSSEAQLEPKQIAALCEEIVQLKKQDIEVIIVSSGAIGLGMGKLDLTKRPTRTSTLQSCAAIGQSLLIDTWQAGFEPFGITVAQLLLTDEDVRARKRHIGIKNLIDELLSMGVVPIINENDSVITEEIQFGNNDILSALVASLAKAELLAILSTAPGLIDMKGSGEIIPIIEAITPDIEAMAGGTTSATAVGGMISKVQAAKVALRSGTNVFIGSGFKASILSELFHGSATGTFFLSKRLPMRSRKRWIAFFQKPQGKLYADAGATIALIENGRSLLAKGITKAEGSFERGALVEVINQNGFSIARGISHYSSEQLKDVIGLSSAQIKERFPEHKHIEVIHRDSLVLTA